MSKVPYRGVGASFFQYSAEVTARRPRGRPLLSAILIALLMAACTEYYEVEPTEPRGRAIDQDTEQGIAGAVVIATYEGSFGAHGASGCNRIESTISDARGWFELPVDHRAGARVLHAYHRDYVRGRSLRLPMQVEGKWSVVVMQPSPDNKTSTPIRVEPEIYRTRMAAKAASRQNSDTYMKRSEVSDAERQSEVKDLAVESLCGGGAQTTSGGVLVLDALLMEATSRRWSSAFILNLEKVRAMAVDQNAGAQRRRAK